MALSKSIVSCAAIALSFCTATAYAAEEPDPYLGANDMKQTPYSYLGEGLTTTPHIRLRPSGHAVTTALAGKEYLFVNGEASEGADKVGANYVKFVDDKKIEFHSYCCPKPTDPEVTSANYIAFELSPKVYFVTFMEQRSKWREQQLVAFIMDLNKMRFTDSFAEDDFGNGELYWMLVQGALVDVTPRR